MAGTDAVAAVNLHRRIDDALRRLGGVKLGHRRFARHPRRTFILGPGGTIDQQRRGIDAERHVGEVTLHHLQFAERCAEQIAVRGALERFIERAAGETKRCSANRGAEHIERRHGDLEAVAGLADQGIGGNS